MGDDQPALSVQFRGLGAAEEHPRVGPGLLSTEGTGPDLVTAPPPFVRRIGEQAAVLAQGEVDAVGERVPIAGRERDAALRIELIAMLAEQFCHGRCPSPPLSPTFMPLVLHFVKSDRHISGEG